MICLVANALGLGWFASVVARDAREHRLPARDILGALAYAPLWPAALAGTVAGWVVSRSWRRT